MKAGWTTPQRQVNAHSSSLPYKSQFCTQLTKECRSHVVPSTFLNSSKLYTSQTYLIPGSDLCWLSGRGCMSAPARTLAILSESPHRTLGRLTRTMVFYHWMAKPSAKEKCSRRAPEKHSVCICLHGSSSKSFLTWFGERSSLLSPQAPTSSWGVGGHGSWGLNPHNLPIVFQGFCGS